MELNELGLDDQFLEQASKLCAPGLRLARVTAVDRGRYVVRNESNWGQTTVSGSNANASFIVLAGDVLF